jgi:putative SOS response-associated peptidase YedK
MCGRYVSKEQAAIERVWNLTRGGGNPFGATFNAAPTQQLPIVRVHPKRGRELTLLRWGLIPSWAKDVSMGAKMINARCETLAGKPAFRSAFQRRRCLVPMAGFYEWQKASAGKVPHFVRLLNADLFAVAGLYEWWPGNPDTAPIESYTIITTQANEALVKLHDRMPVILNERDYDAWLDPKNEKTEAINALLKPYPAEEMAAYPVSTRVNNVRNDDDSLIHELGQTGATFIPAQSTGAIDDYFNDAKAKLA